MVDCGWLWLNVVMTRCFLSSPFDSGVLCVFLVVSGGQLFPVVSCFCWFVVVSGCAWLFLVSGCLCLSGCVRVSVGVLVILIVFGFSWLFFGCLLLPVVSRCL